MTKPAKERQNSSAGDYRMKDIECATCRGRGKVQGRDGSTSICMDCGGAGFAKVEESEMTEDMEDRVINQ